MAGRVQGFDPLSTPRSPSQAPAFGDLGLWTLDVGLFKISPAGGSTNAAGGHNPLQPGRWRDLREFDRPQGRRSGASSAPPDNRSGSARSSPRGSRPAGSGSWSWSSWQVPFVVRGIGAPNVLWRRGTSCRFRATFLQTSSLFLAVWRQETRTASLRTARVETSPWKGNPAARVQAFPPRKSKGRFHGATALGPKGGTSAAPLAEWLSVNDHKCDETIDRSGKRNST
jgi:hypothetical protein